MYYATVEDFYFGFGIFSCSIFFVQPFCSVQSLLN